MKRNINRKIKWTLFISTCLLLVVTPFLSVSGEQPDGLTIPSEGPIGVPAVSIPDGDWDYKSNPPHMFSIPTGNVGIGGVPPTDSKLFVLSETMAWQYGLNVSSGLGIKSVSTAWEGTGIYGEGGHIGVAGSGYIGLYGQGFHGGWFEGNGYFSGNLGVGNLSDGSRLHVEGDIYCNGSLIGGSHDHNDLYYTESEIDALLAGLSSSQGHIEGGKYDGKVMLNYIETDPGAEFIIDFESPFTTIDEPLFLAYVYLRAAADGLTEGSSIKVAEEIQGSPGNWTGFKLAASKPGGGGLSHGTTVYVTWMAVSKSGTAIQGTASNHCAGTEILTTGDFSDPAPLNNQVKIVFKNVTFSDASNIQLDVSAIVYSSSTGAGFPALIMGIQITTEYAIVDLQGWNGNSWVDLYLDDIVQVSYTAVEQGTSISSSSQTDIVTGTIPWDNNPPYYVGTGFSIDVSGDLPPGFTLIDVTAKGRKAHQMTGEIQDEPPLILYPRVNGTNIEILVWDAFGNEYGGTGWSNMKAHIEYTLFMKKS